jgi:hypothetical protein
MSIEQVTPPSDSIVRKIQLLLNLGQRSEGNEAEAAAAMARAQELLARYNLDLATVQDKVVAGGTAEREAEQKRDYAKSKRSAMYKWQQRLVRTLAEANFCVYWVEETTEKAYIPPSNRKSYEDYDENGMGDIRVKRHKVLGRVANTTGVMIMVDYLLDTIERLLPYPQQERLSRNANLWREGCSDRLVERIKAKAEAMRQADYATQGEAAYTTAIQVADLARKEEAGNYDFRYGAGAWARKLASEAASEAYWTSEAIAARQAERDAALAASRALETPKQKAAREKREAKDAERQARYSERYWARQDREEAAREARLTSTAYRQGRAKGDSIGLDTQLDTTKTKSIAQEASNVR